MKLCGFEVGLDKPFFLIKGRVPGLGGAKRGSGQGARDRQVEGEVVQ